MNTTDELHIELYIRFPKDLSEEEYHRIEQLIQNDAEAKELAHWFREYYQNFDLLNRPLILSLKRKKIQAKQSGPLVLAALSPLKNQSGLITKATFGSEEESTLVRVLENTSNHKVQVHVLSKYIGEEDRVLIGFENSGVELITQKGGKLKNIESEALSDINWEQAMLLLRLSSSSCSYNPSFEDKISVCDECTMTISDNICTFSTANEDTSRILLEQDDHIELFYTLNSKATFSINHTKPFTIYLYT